MNLLLFFWLLLDLCLCETCIMPSYLIKISIMVKKRRLYGDSVGNFKLMIFDKATRFNYLFFIRYIFISLPMIRDFFSLVICLMCI